MATVYEIEITALSDWVTHSDDQIAARIKQVLKGKELKLRNVEIKVKSK